MNKELLTVEFRYNDAPKDDRYSDHKSKVVTIGIFDTFDEAMKAGNAVLSDLSKHFKFKQDEKFVKNYLFGSARRLVTDRSMNIFVKIEKLDLSPLSEVVTEVYAATARYRDYKKKQNEED